MSEKFARALAHPNIAFIKYWGNKDHQLRIPVNGSISMNLEGLHTKTSVRFDKTLKADKLILNAEGGSEKASLRVSKFLDIVRKLAGIDLFALVDSENNFPMGSGIASSASAFAALALASSVAADLDLTEKELSILARKGSGSASRSIPAGFVEWHGGSTDRDSFAESIAPTDHWDLVDCIAIVDERHKETGSSSGHILAPSSPLQATRIAGAAARIDEIRQAVIQKDFARFAKMLEADSLLMHAIMMTSEPSLLYWAPTSLSILKAVTQWRLEGIMAASTMDAGPNVHVITTAKFAATITKNLEAIEGVSRVIQTKVGPEARLID